MSQNQFVFDAIGTSWKITLASPLPEAEKSALLSKIHAFIEEFDKTYSRFRADSLITQISQKKGNYLFPENSKPLFSLYEKLYSLTNGVFTPLVGNLLSDAGYDASYSLTPKKLHPVFKMEDVLVFDFPNLIVKKPILLDFGAAGKGYLVDLVGEILEKSGVGSFVINAGGDILVKNWKQPLRIGLEHPKNQKQIIGVAQIKNGSICGSAGNRRVWGNFHHIMHPQKRESVKDILAVWVIANTTLLADGLSTALFFKPANVLEKEFSFSYALVYHDLTLERSNDFPAEVYFSEYNNTTV